MDSASIDDEKQNWGDGPWLNEPDEVEIHVSPSTGYFRRAKRNPHTGTWCGYVIVPNGHPAFGKHYARLTRDLDGAVHGGITFSAEVKGPDTGTVKGTRYWGFGFDCAHHADLMPRHAYSLALLSSVAEDSPPLRESLDRLAETQTYRTLEFVMDNICALDDALHAIEVSRNTGGAQ